MQQSNQWQREGAGGGHDLHPSKCLFNTLIKTKINIFIKLSCNIIYGPVTLTKITKLILSTCKIKFLALSLRIMIFT